ncbi:MAG: rhodanese-like domain-containing protein [Pirellulales bacterium]
MSLASLRILFVCVVLLASLVPASAVEPTKDSLETVKKNLAEKQAVLVDVRSLDEWKEGHVEGALHLPLAEIKKRSTDKEALAKWLAEQLPADKIVYVHCMAGIRAKQACGLLEPADKRDWRCLKAGYEDLLDAGLPKAK